MTNDPMKNKTPTINIPLRLSLRLAPVLVVLVALAISVPLSTQAQQDHHGYTLIEFDAPGAGTGFFQGTDALSINPAGTIMGYYSDASFVLHGFVRSASGTITTFDPLGSTLTGPVILGINDAGTITGSYLDASGVLHGFVRSASGIITTFDPLGSTGTLPVGMNPAGTITGDYFDANGVYHGFVRSASGTITTLDAPDAGTGAFQGVGTFPNSINPAGAIAGYYYDANSVLHGFLASPFSIGPQAMEGNLKLSPGATLQVGYDFTMPGNHPAAAVSFTGATVTFAWRCVSGPESGVLVVPITDRSYTDGHNSPAWYPSGDQHSSLVYQGSVSVPNVCGGGPVSFQAGGTFSAGSISSTDTKDKLNIRWHYSGAGSAGNWSATQSVVP